MGQFNEATPQYPGGPQYQQPQPQFNQQQPQFQQQQPGAHAQMSYGAGGGNRNANNIPNNSNGQRDWSNGLCSCFGDCGTCVIAFCLPCIVYGSNKTRLEHLERNGTPHPTGGDSCGGDTWIHCLLGSCIGVGWVLQIGTRGAVRHRYSIEGGGCGDCMSAACCGPCDLVQESREIELEEQSFGKHA